MAGLLKELLKKLRQMVKKKEKTLVPAKKKATQKRVISRAQGLAISPRKLKLMVDPAKKLSPAEAIKRLGIVNNKGARVLIRVIRAAIANAQNNAGLDPSSLKFDEILVDQASGLVRRDKSHGARFSGGTIKKRRTHLKITLVGKEK